MVDIPRPFATFHRENGHKGFYYVDLTPVFLSTAGSDRLESWQLFAFEAVFFFLLTDANLADYPREHS